MNQPTSKGVTMKRRRAVSYEPDNPTYTAGFLMQKGLTDKCCQGYQYRVIIECCGLDSQDSRIFLAG